MHTTVEIPNHTNRMVELEAYRLLEAFGHYNSPIVDAPIPIERILELHLRLDLTICDLRDLLGFDDVLGALSVDAREVMVDERLDPDEFPELEGRYRFTLAHEIGHWQLHRHIYKHQTDQPPFISRTSAASHRLERQANHFAACVLMPRPLVFSLWRDIMGGSVITLAQLRRQRQAIVEDEIVRRGFVPQTSVEEANMVLEWVARPLAEEFRVSPAAMRIRMQELKLIIA